MDPLDDLPQESRNELVAAVRDVLDTDPDTAEDLIRASEPLWEALEQAGALVDSWGSAEFSLLFPRVLVYIRDSV